MSKIDKDKQYKTREGREVRIYATDGVGTYPIHGAIKRSDGWVSATWGSTGYVVSPGREMPDDIIEVKRRKKIERWVMVERHDACSMWINKPSDIETANAFAVKHIVFEVEEGEGIDEV
jgi:hypothetical protein